MPILGVRINLNAEALKSRAFNDEIIRGGRHLEVPQNLCQCVPLSNKLLISRYTTIIMSRKLIFRVQNTYRQIMLNYDQWYIQRYWVAKSETYWQQFQNTLKVYLESYNILISHKYFVFEGSRVESLSPRLLNSTQGPGRRKTELQNSCIPRILRWCGWW